MVAQCCAGLVTSNCKIQQILPGHPFETAIIRHHYIMIHIERLRLRVDLLYNWRIVNLMKCQRRSSKLQFELPHPCPDNQFQVPNVHHWAGQHSFDTFQKDSCSRWLRAYLDSDRLRPVESPETFHLRARPTQRNPWCLGFVFFLPQESKLV